MALIDNKKAYVIVPKSCIINCVEIYKISDEGINFIEKTAKTSKEEFRAGGKSLADANILRCIFQGDAQSPLLFVIAMTPLNKILWKCTAGYKLTKSLEMISHLMYMDNIKLFEKT